MDFSVGRIVLRADDAALIRLGKIDARILVSGADTAGAFGLVESGIQPRVLAGPMHTHVNEQGFWYVLEGEFGAQVGDQEVHAGQGALVLAPRGVPHTYWNPGDTPARYLEIFSPAGLELMFERLGAILIGDEKASAPEAFNLLESFGLAMDFDSVATLSERHGVSLTGD
ncbi:MAG: cupin domain-containing protein [Actinomycetota bacterium]